MLSARPEVSALSILNSGGRGRPGEDVPGRAALGGQKAASPLACGDGPTGAQPVGNAPAALQTWISRKLSGAATWALDDLDRLSAHYGTPVPDLVAGVDRAIHCPPAAAYHSRAAQLTINP
ncbi:hypothetical protein [Streptomyces microflavus]